jgi:hypothetical protein
MGVLCCFCGGDLLEDEPGLVTLIVDAVPRSGTPQPHAQQMWCHVRCLAARLNHSAVFDADHFEVEDAETLTEADRLDETALARAADDGWPSREEEEQHRPP